MRKFITLLFFILCCNVTKAQFTVDSLAVNVSLIKEADTIAAKCLVFIDSNNEANPSNILQLAHWESFSQAGIQADTPFGWVGHKIYLKFALHNSKEIPDTPYFYPGNSFRSIRLYKILAAGNLLALKDESKTAGFQPIALASKNTSFFIAELQLTKRKFNDIAPQIIKRDYLPKYQAIFYTSGYNQLIVGYVLSGLLIMMILFNGANFWLNGKKEFLYNCCYGICMFGIIFLTTFTEKRSGVFASFFMGYLAFALLMIGMVFYIAFTRKFLETKTKYPLLNKIFYCEEIGLLISLLAFSILYFFTENLWLQKILENTMKIVVLIIGIVYIYIAIRQKNKLINYLAMGNITLIIFSIISLTFIILSIKKDGIFTSAILYYEVGIVCELSFFLLGLTYKTRTGLIEKIKEQEAMKLVAEKQIFETKLAVINAQQEERNRISADMHDDLGAGVTAIRLFSELAKSRLGKDTVPEIEKISSSANELLNNMNAIIWTMNSSNDSFASMVAYIRSYAFEYFENTGIKCNIEIETGLPNFAVNGDIRRNVFLVVKEALNNILKHARATEIWLVLKREGEGISFLIKDNGTGIDFENLRRFGNGLKNMKQRMAKSGIEFSIENNNGTLVKLHASAVES